jgi:FkbM family methyltransferase
MSFTKKLRRAVFPSYRIKEVLYKLNQIEKQLIDINIRTGSAPPPPTRGAPQVVAQPDSTTLRQAYVNLIGVLVPGKVAHYEKKRFGSQHDGGYVMLDHLDNIAAAYSLGIGQNITWDCEMANRNVPVFQFDDTIKNLPYKHSLFSFFPIRIGGADDKSQNIISLGSIIKKFDHGGKDLILKMDIEGAEWEVLEKIKPEVLVQFRQIVCEFHGCTSCLQDKAWLNRATRALANLTRFHRVIHVHANNVVPPVSADNTLLNEILEVTLVRTESYDLADTYELFPGDLDSPNIPDYEDISLGTFRY